MDVAEKANTYYLECGMNCGEACARALLEDAGADKEIVDAFVSAAGVFGMGIGTGCLCGAVGGSIITLGYLLDKQGVDKIGRMAAAKELHEQFRALFKITCCRALSKGLAVGSLERKQKCAGLVREATRIAHTLINRQ